MNPVKLITLLLHTVFLVTLICTFGTFKDLVITYYVTKSLSILIIICEYLPNIIFINLIGVLLLYGIMHFELNRKKFNPINADRSILSFLILLITEFKLVILWSVLNLLAR